MPTYPDAPRLDLVDDLHGRPVPDPYRWLEDKDDERTLAWSAAQDELMDAERAQWTATDRFREHITELLQGGFVSPPYRRGERTFFMRRTGDQQFPVLWTIDPDGTERVLIDPIALDPAGLTTLDSWQPSKEGDLLAYQLSEGGTEESIVRVMDVATGEVVDGPIDRARYSPIAWLPGGKAYYYVRRLDPSLLPEDEQQFHRRVYLHQVGADTATDVEIFGAGRVITNYYGVSVSRDGRWLQISSQEGTEPRNDLWLADLTTSPHESPSLVEVQIGVDAQTGLHLGRDGRAYVSTDRDAPRGRLAVTDPTSPAYENWVDLLPEDPTAVLEDVAILDGDELERPLLVAAWTRHSVGELTLHDLATGEKIRDIELPGVGTLGGLVEQPDGGPMIWFVYTDYTTQPHVYTFDGRTGAVELYAAPPGLVDVPRVHSRQVTYTSADGTEVRMFILSPADGPDRPRPTILYGYGGFGIPMHPGYSATMLAWVAAGGVYAVACLRGGGEEGEEWHRAGMLGKQAERVRRLPRRGGVAAARGLDHARAARDQRRQQRRPARRRRADAAARPLRHRGVRRAAARHGALRHQRARPHLDRRVRRPRRARGARLAARVLAVPQRRRRAWTTRRRCSWCSATTRAPTRCTGASCARRCSTPPAASGRSSSAQRRTWATEPARCRSRSTRAPRCWPSPHGGRGSSSPDASGNRCGPLVVSGP